MLSVLKVSKTYPRPHSGEGIRALREVTFSVEDGSVVVVVGPSGCGKTTLLNIIAGLDQSFEGEIRHQSVHQVRVGYMFQTPSLIPWRTVWDNIVIGCEIEHLPESEYRGQALTLLERYGLEEFAKSYPATLSQGMQQRVSLIRMVLFGAELFLLDEAFSRMDYFLRRALYRDLNTLVEEQHATAVLVTHDIEEAVLLGDKVIVLSHRPAQVLSEISIPVNRSERVNSPPGSDLMAPYLKKVWHSLQADTPAA